jgi:hypothetical protein
VRADLGVLAELKSERLVHIGKMPSESMCFLCVCESPITDIDYGSIQVLVSGLDGPFHIAKLGDL